MTRPIESSGADRDRTDDLLHAMQALSQLSYGPGVPEQKYYIAASIAAAISSFAFMPTIVSTTWPSLKIKMLGID